MNGTEKTMNNESKNVVANAFEAVNTATEVRRAYTITGVTFYDRKVDKTTGSVVSNNTPDSDNIVTYRMARLYFTELRPAMEKQSDGTYTRVDVYDFETSYARLFKTIIEDTAAYYFFQGVKANGQNVENAMTLLLRDSKMVMYSHFVLAEDSGANRDKWHCEIEMILQSQMAKNVYAKAMQSAEAKLLAMFGI